MNRLRRLIVEKRAIPAARRRAAGFERPMSHFASSFDAEKRDIPASRPLAAEVQRMLRGGPIRFPAGLL